MSSAEPEKVAQLLGEAELLSSPYNDGVIQWQRWPGPDAARPLLLLHGGFGSWTHWIANIAELRRRRTVWTLDMPGLGLSANVPPGPDLVDFSSAIVDSLDVLFGRDIEFDLGGFSFGALVGAELAKQVQHRCHHFIACGAAGFGDLHVQVDLQRPPGPGVPQVQAERIHRENLHALMFSRDFAIDDLAVWVHRVNLEQSRYNSRRLAKGAGFLNALNDIPARLCGIWGSADATAGGERAIEQRRALFREAQPDSAFHILDGVGHWAMYEAARQFNEIVDTELCR